jgi:hypothetical protein
VTGAVVDGNVLFVGDPFGVEDGESSPPQAARRNVAAKAEARARQRTSRQR